MASELFDQDILIAVFHHLAGSAGLRRYLKILKYNQ